MPVRSVLVADDNTDVRQAFLAALRADGIVARGAANVYEARRLIALDAPDVVLADIRMPGDGMVLLREVHAHHPGTAVIVMTAFDQPGDQRRAFGDGAVDFLVKPVSRERLREALLRAFSARPR